MFILYTVVAPVNHRITVSQYHTSIRRVNWILKAYTCRLSNLFGSELIIYQINQIVIKSCLFSKFIKSLNIRILEAFQLKDQIKATSHLPNDAIELSVFALSSQRAQISLATAQNLSQSDVTQSCTC